jgi:hypothetical protein
MGPHVLDLLSRYPAGVAGDVRQTIALDVPADDNHGARRWTSAGWRLQHLTGKALSAVPGVGPGVVQTLVFVCRLGTSVGSIFGVAMWCGLYPRMRPSEFTPSRGAAGTSGCCGEA